MSISQSTQLYLGKNGNHTHHIHPLGFAAPAFQLPDAISGETLDSNALFEGGPTVVVFMCNHCPFVIHLLKAFVEVADEYQAKGVNFIAISSNNTATHPQDGFPEMGRLAEQYAMPFPYLYDESQAVARAYDAACTPDFSIFDAENRCVYRGQFDGSRPGNEIPITGRDVRTALDLLLTGQTVPVEGQIPSIGCNVKWKEN